MSTSKSRYSKAVMGKSKKERKNEAISVYPNPSFGIKI